MPGMQRSSIFPKAILKSSAEEKEQWIGWKMRDLRKQENTGEGRKGCISGKFVGH